MVETMEIDPILKTIDHFEKKIQKMDPVTKKAMLANAFPEHFIYTDPRVHKRIKQIKEKINS